ncbi:MAG: glycosyltransferase family 4 protein [Patescibacteria group bacterium]|nr:glycosyltransferase family 4 protein [Patescibacteria group bacterium]MDD5294465.1 glycosyltransferase family 4 protein [Patescibacteria group bacterium]MDD5554376.1 glycosyltransferase family 4 protein [Patescibacteria group bacterium]
MPKKTILYLITQSELGGAQRYSLDLALALKNEFNVIVASGEENGKNTLSDKLGKAKIKYYPIPYLKRSISLISDFLALIQIVKLIKKTKPDIIHLNSSKISILGSLAASISKLLTKSPTSEVRHPKSEVVYTAHGWVFNEPMPVWKKLFYKYAEKFTARFKDKIICVSEFDYKAALEQKICPKEKLIVIHNGIAPIEFLPRQEAREKLNLPENKFIIGSIGNLYRTKGFSYLIETVKKLAEEGMEITAVIIGEGLEKKSLTELIKKHKLENNVILAGRIPEAARLLSAFDIYVCSSIKEGLSYTIIETMLNGLPIIATRVGGNPELIEDGKTGLLINSQDASDLAEKIKKLRNNTDLQQEMSTQARIKAQEEFNLEKMIRETKEVYYKKTN